MSALGQTRSFDPRQPNVRYAPKADIHSHCTLLMGGQVGRRPDQGSMRVLRTHAPAKEGQKDSA